MHFLTVLEGESQNGGVSWTRQASSEGSKEDPSLPLLASGGSRSFPVVATSLQPLPLTSRGLPGIPLVESPSQAQYEAFHTHPPHDSPKTALG